MYVHTLRERERERGVSKKGKATQESVRVRTCVCVRVCTCAYVCVLWKTNLLTAVEVRIRGLILALRMRLISSFTCSNSDLFIYTNRKRMEWGNRHPSNSNSVEPLRMDFVKPHNMLIRDHKTVSPTQCTLIWRCSSNPLLVTSLSWTEGWLGWEGKREALCL